MEVFESTFVAGTRREAAADGGGRKAEPLGRGGTSILLEVGGFNLGGLDERRGGGAIFGMVSVALLDGSCFCSKSDVLVALPLLCFGLPSCCAVDDAETGSSDNGLSKVNVGLSSRIVSSLVFSSTYKSSSFGKGENSDSLRYLYRR